MSTAELQHRFKNKPVIIVMGSSGCGKSTIAQALSQHLDLPYIEGDELHPAANIKKMSDCIPLTDDDRWPWFELLGMTMKKNIDQTGGVVTACSALKRIYREHLINTIAAPTLFVYLDVSRELLLQRMLMRQEHYMPTSLLDSQLATLEPPDSDEFAISVKDHSSVDEIVQFVLSRLKEFSTFDSKNKGSIK